MGLQKAQTEVSVVVFSDLDGTLLDHNSYRFDEAEEALRLLRERRYPLVLVSSKTRSEFGEWRTKLQNSAPFVVENGGAIFIPRRTFSFEVEAGHRIDEFCVVELGMKYDNLLKSFDELRKRTGLPLRGFHEMSVDEVAALANLAPEQARMAMEREYSEPFVLLADDRNLLDLKAAAIDLGVRLTTGGRFHHLMGGNDKGKAVRILVELFEREFSGTELFTVGIGDSANDIPMLNVVTHPIVVQRPDGSYMSAHLPPGTMFAKGRGPVGWLDGIVQTIEKIDHNGNVPGLSD
ncbi:MAG: HAD-IIB family hydrolase [Bacteroidota bacterium]